MKHRLNFPDLETDRLILRAICPEDEEFVYRQFSDPEVTRHLYDEEPVATMEEAGAIIEFYENSEQKTYHRWVILRKEDHTPMGTCGFHCWDKRNHIVEVGYDLYTTYWGHGFMAEALRAIINSGFQNMQLNRIQAFVSTDNIASCRALERQGFQQEGIIREKHLFRGKYYDHYCYSLLKSDWVSKS